MSARELVVLGTSSAVPTRTRNHNGYFLRWDATGFLFDPGEGTQRQLTFAGIPASAVDVVCITHSHGDHCLGLPGLVQRRVADGARSPLELYYPVAASPVIEALLVAAGPAAASVNRHPSGPGLVADTGVWRLSAAALDHRVPALGWRVQEPDGVRVLPDRAAALGVLGPAIGRLLVEGSVVAGGRRVLVEEVTAPRPGQSFAFVMDTRPCPGALEIARGVDLLVCEATFLGADAELADAYAHCTAEQAATIARDAGVRRLLLTHFSQRYPDSEASADEARAVFEDVQALRDLDRVAFPSRRNDES